MLCFHLHQMQRIFLAPGEHQIVHIVQSLLLAFLVEQIKRGKQGGLLRGEGDFTVYGIIGLFPGMRMEYLFHPARDGKSA